MASNVTMNDLGNDNCVVCFREIEIFSIGECNHPVCHECSARMRVLCLQNECPICRQDLPKVIFTRNILPYVTLDKQFRSGLYDKKFRICFEDIDIQKKFYRLLDNTCSVCDIRPFLEFDHLKDHVRKVHELFYCDICTDNLKIFSSERRCYSRPDLATHRRRGDPDNTSHKGHPLCEYCELRFLDKDELFRHLRREHYYCHFCDADGINLFYANYGDMREHFKGEHYLCEEADCADEKFTAVFRTDIDLKAHRSSVHSHSMTKFEARQARTLELEFSFGPRGRGGGPATSEIQRGGGGRNRNNNQRDTQREFDRFNENCYPQIQPTPQIDSKNEQQFPSLGGKPGSSVQLASSVRHITYGQAGLQRTKENYPALGNQQPNPLQPSTSKSSKKPTASMLLKNPGGSGTVLGTNRSSAAPASKKVFNAAAEFPALSTNTLKKSPTVTVAPVKPRDDYFAGGSVHGLSRPSTAPTPKKAVNPSSDFPSLSTNASKKKNNNNLKALLHEDLPAPTKNVHANLVPAKHRALVDEYVSLASKMSSKVQTIQQVDVILPKSEFKASVPKLNSANNFPSLGLSGGLEETAPQWITLKSSNGRPTQSQNDSPRKGKKVNEMPDLSLDYNKNGSKSNDKAKKEEKVKVGSNDFKPKSTGDESSNNNNKENKSKNVVKDISKQSGYDFPKANPPPGFSSNSSQPTQQLKKPPGFHNVSPDSANDIVPVSKGSYSYMPPGNATKRNTALVGEFQKALNTHESMSQFREMSQMFRDGQYFAKAYYESCRIVLGENFNEIFPELLALLPDIDKQQSLYVAHTQSKEQSEQKTKKKSNKLKQLEVCATCKQVLLTPDLMSHLQLHKLENSFPSLSNGSGGGSSSSNSSTMRPSHWKK